MKRREVPVSPEMRRILERQRERFVRKFGREPGPNDPVFFDEASDEPRPMTDAETDRMKAAVVNAMKKVGIDPAYIHAYRQTGRIVSTANKSLLTSAEYEEWESLVRSHRRLTELKQPGRQPDRPQAKKERVPKKK